MKYILLLLAVSVIACGRSNYSVRLELPTEQYHDAKAAFEQLNYEAKFDIVKYNNSKPGIIIKRTDDANVKYPILGYAVVGGPTCEIYIPDRTFLEEYELLVTVLWHELGHCHNIMHSTNPKEIMFSSVREIFTYSNKYKDLFFRRLYEAQN
jgi:hypothetical protein